MIDKSERRRRLASIIILHGAMIIPWDAGAGAGGRKKEDGV